VGGNAAVNIKGPLPQGPYRVAGLRLGIDFLNVDVARSRHSHAPAARDGRVGAVAPGGQDEQRSASMGTCCDLGA